MLFLCFLLLFSKRTPSLQCLPFETGDVRSPTLPLAFFMPMAIHIVPSRVER